LVHAIRFAGRALQAMCTRIGPHTVLQAELALHAGLVRVIRSSCRSLQAMCIAIGRDPHAVITQAQLAFHAGLVRVIRSACRSLQATRIGIGPVVGSMWQGKCASRLLLCSISEQPSMVILLVSILGVCC
jgi:hypothetical protein